MGLDNSRALEVRCTRSTAPSWIRPSRRPRTCRRPDGVGAQPLISTDLASPEWLTGKYSRLTFLPTKISYIERNRMAGRKGRRGYLAGGESWIGLDAA